jgi:thiol:disulfide interchange protein DsbD
MKKALLMILFFLQTTLFAFGEDVLTVDQAFIPSVTSQDGTIHTDIKLADEIYAYDDQLKYKIIQPKEVDLNPLLSLPKPVKLHEFIVHRGDIKVDIPLALIEKEIGKKPFKLQINYQGCSEKGLCYQPMSPIYAFNADGTLQETKTKVAQERTSKEPSQKPASAWGAKESDKSVNAKAKEKSQTVKKATISEESAIADKLKNSSFFTILALFFGFGLVLAFTPCIFPMIPILSSIITLEAKQSGGMSLKRGIFLSLVYVVSSALIYALAGILSAVFGANILSAMQNPWVIVIFAAIFIALAFSMFGYYEIQLPRSLQNFANKTSDNSQGNGIFGVAVMGALSALIVGPCVAPPLAGALLFIGQTGDVVLGGIALFLLGLGMGAPLLLIGAGGGKFMPKPGGWMTRVSYVFGVVMLGIAIWFLSRIVPDAISMLLWALLFIGSGIYAGVFEPFKEGVSGLSKLGKVIAVMLLAYGLVLFMGVFTGGSNPLDPLHKLYTNNQSTIGHNKPTFQKIASLSELEKVIKDNTKPIMIDFSADWCASCKELDEITFEDPKVQALMQKFDLYRIDVTNNSDEDKMLQKKFSVVGPPAIIFYDTQHQELSDKKVVGYKPPEVFAAHLTDILGE